MSYGRGHYFTSNESPEQKAYEEA